MAVEQMVERRSGADRRRYDRRTPTIPKSDVVRALPVRRPWQRHSLLRRWPVLLLAVAYALIGWSIPASPFVTFLSDLTWLVLFWGGALAWLAVWLRPTRLGVHIAVLAAPGAVLVRGVAIAVEYGQYTALWHALSVVALLIVLYRRDDLNIRDG